MKNKKRLLLFIPVLAVFFISSGCGSSTIVTHENLLSAKSSYGDGTKLNVIINGKSWCSEVMRSEAARRQGLSGKSALEKNTGMIFIMGDLPESMLPSFWMKDMKFDLDLVWINDSKVVDISRNVQHPIGLVDDTDLPRYTPKTSANIVLEVNAGEADSLAVNNPVTYGTPCATTPSL